MAPLPLEEKKVRKRGRSVAQAEAVMPRPVSAVEQMATLVVAQRKSARLARS